jgi:hypothetical protein
MNIERLLDWVNKAIHLATFDRERFRVRAIQSVDGTEIQMYAETRFPFPEEGKILVNYQIVRLEDCANGFDVRQLTDIVEGAVQMLEWKIEDDGKSVTRPD